MLKSVYSEEVCVAKLKCHLYQCSLEIPIVVSGYLGRSSILTNSTIAGLSSENVINGVMGDTTPSTSEYGSSMKVSAHLIISLSYL